jgi:hypothetical protein
MHGSLLGKGGIDQGQARGHGRSTALMTPSARRSNAW